MIISKKYLIEPDDETLNSLWFVSDLCNEVWNAAVEQRLYKRNYSIDMYSQKKELVSIKADFPEYKIPSSQVFQNLIIQLDKNFKYFYKCLRNADYSAKPPRYKSKKHFFTQTYNATNRGFFIEAGYLHVSYGLEAGSTLKIKLPDDAKNLTSLKELKIKQDSSSGKFYACISYLYSEVEYTPNEHSIYFDPGCKTALTGITTEGKFFEYDINHLRKINMETLIYIDKLKSELSRKVKNSSRWNRINKKIKKAFSKIKTRTKMVLSRLANQILKDHPNIKQFKIGDWSPNETACKDSNKFKSRRINRAMLNNNPLTKLIKILSYKAEMAGKKVSKFDERGSTRTCSMCGQKHTEGYSPEKRIFKCVDQIKCKFEYSRDHQSGLNFIKSNETALWQSLVSDLPTSSKRTSINAFSCRIQRTITTL